MKFLPFFVYGTLMRGGCYESVWPCRPEKVVVATTVGALYDFGTFPCLLPGNDKVVGELWHISKESCAATLAALDRLEGFDQGGENLFLRTIVECQTADGPQDAYTYIYDQPLDKRHQRIEPNEDGVCIWSPSRK